MAKTQDRTKDSFWKYKLSILKNKAHKRGLECLLSFQDLRKLRNGSCFYCGTKNEFMTIDRKNNFTGYTRDNCVTACHLCNKIKSSNLAFRHMVMLGNTIKEIKKENPWFWNFCPNSKQKEIIIPGEIVVIRSSDIPGHIFTDKDIV